MVTSIAFALPTLQEQLEDPLAHLPHSRIVEYSRGQIVYDPHHQPAGLYLVIDGIVKVSQVSGQGRNVVIDIYRADEFFGEAALLNQADGSEQAVVLERARLMMWPTASLQEIVVRRPRLAVALLQLLVQRTVTFKERIESLSEDTIERRLARSLVRFAEHFGVLEDDGSLRMPPFTHELLAQYVCTSREVITLYMTRFRRQGYLRYSRKGISVYTVAFRDWLAQAGVEALPQPVNSR